jgi:hypothetical protein
MGGARIVEVTEEKRRVIEPMTIEMKAIKLIMKLHEQFPKSEVIHYTYRNSIRSNDFRVIDVFRIAVKIYPDDHSKGVERFRKLIDESIS